jgi:hypothetical protein
METNDDLRACMHWMGKSITWRRRDITTDMIQKWKGVSKERHQIEIEKRWQRNEENELAKFYDFFVGSFHFKTENAQ